MGPAAVPFDAPMPPAVLGADTGVHCAMLRLGWFSVEVAASAMGPLRHRTHTSAQPGPALGNGIAHTRLRSLICGPGVEFCCDFRMLAGGQLTGPARGLAAPAASSRLAKFEEEDHLFQACCDTNSRRHGEGPGRSAKGSDRLPLQRAAGDIALALQALRIRGFLLDGAPALSKEVGTRARDGDCHGGGW